ncbi:MAG: GTP-binding protein [Rhodospirillaceae bacterium]
MRLLTFKASSLRQAMALVRRELGDDANIVSTQTYRETGEATIVAARHQDRDDPRMGQVPLSPDARIDRVLETLLVHGVPLPLGHRLAQAAGEMESPAPISALAGALDIDFRFSPIDVTADNQRLMLVGPPGSGKTLALIKLAARAIMAKRSVRFLTTDLKRAGAVEQLTALAKIMDQEVFITDTAEEMAQFVARTPARSLVLVDSPGVNHRSHMEMDNLMDFVNAAPVEPVLVLNAGMDAFEAAENAVAFAAAGAERMLVTRTDASGRLGAVLAAMESAAVALAGTTGSPDPVEGFYPTGAADLAGLYFGDILSLSSELPMREGPKTLDGKPEAADHEDFEPEEINIALPAKA